jgi:o-succinylbenzoate synthase
VTWRPSRPAADLGVQRTVTRLSIPFAEPFATAGGVVAARELLLLRVEDEQGITGHGEAAPFEPYDGVSIQTVAAELRDAGGAGGPHARAAEEMAQLDVAARREGVPVGEPGAEAIAVNRTLAAGPPDEAAERAREGVRAGYSCFKLKVGLPDDQERVAAVRAALGPWPALRLDANCAWSPGEAIRAARALSAHDIQLLEQPCRTLEELREVRRAVDVPIAADEPIASVADVDRAASLGACDAINVKLAGCGGFGAARDALRAAASRGLDAYLSSTLDGPWGIAAALQLAAQEGVTLACGLATLELFDAGIARALPGPRGGLLEVPPGPGLGVSVSEEDLAAVAVDPPA